jgi:hypothetical protein
MDVTAQENSWGVLPTGVQVAILKRINVLLAQDKTGEHDWLKTMDWTKVVDNYLREDEHEVTGFWGELNEDAAERIVPTLTVL